ncbi:MAG: type VII secretion protein EssC [Butyrivibrio sp.]|nr:type VII secretion protein EssC [Butyrivibrio sp.]
MSTVVSIFSKKAYRDYVLIPPQSNADFSISVSGTDYWLENDLTICLEVLGGDFWIRPDDLYKIYIHENGQEELITYPLTLENGLSLRLLTRDNEELSVVVRQKDSELVPDSKLAVKKEETRITIGSSSSCDIVHSFRELIADEQAVIENRDGNAVIVCNEPCGVYVNGSVVRKERRINCGDIINIYDLRIVWLGKDSDMVFSVNDRQIGAGINKEKLIGFIPDHKNDEPVRMVSSDELFFRSPRNTDAIETDSVSFEIPPSLSKHEQQGVLQTIGNAFLMVIPMLAGCSVMIIASMRSGSSSGFFMYSGLVMALASAIVSIIWGFKNNREQKRKLVEEEKQRFEAYGKYLYKKKSKIEEMYTHNRTTLLGMYPGAKDCAYYSKASQFLWNRNAEQDDFLKIRLGIGDLPFQGKIDIPEDKFYLFDDSLRDLPEYIKTNFETLYDVPILMDLKEHPIIGFVGGEDRYGAFEAVRALIVQLAATHCYTDVKMVFLFDSTSSMDSTEWGFVRWLPHVWSEDRKIRYVAATKSERNDVCFELAKVLRERNDNNEITINTDEQPLPYYVLFVSDPSLIEGEVISNYVFNNSKKLGLTTIFLTEMYEDQPNACNYFVQNDSKFSGIKGLEYDDKPVSFDCVSNDLAEAFARRISGIRVKETSTGGEIPDSITFLAMYGVNTPEQLNASERWLKNQIYDSISGLLGFNGAKSQCHLDLHEKYHGPHGLVAGTTGSGKSETLQTYLLSLAVNYSPDDINFFIIDYKGGGMANLFEKLPHLAGQISNLSGAQIKRALISIKAENRRRQILFNNAGVNNINKYTKLYKNNEVKEPIPHLIIVIDEFAELKREEPEFMRELISVAQVGRSLGVHLILATQKPSGTVDDNIWSNSKFRLCLRVQTKEDSMEMLGKPDAAYITQAGRGYLQVGTDEVYEMFQSGYSGAPYDPDLVSSNEATGLISRTGQIELIFNRKSEKTGQSEYTQLDAVIDNLVLLAKKHGYESTHRLWMPVLNDHIYLEDCEEYRKSSFDYENKAYKVSADDIRTNWDLSCIVGYSDDPQNQEQKPLRLSLSDGGNHAIVGTAISGKSTFMATTIFALATKYSPDLFQFYAIDFSSHILACFDGLPHCGGVVFDGEDEKLERLTTMIGGMLEERKKIFRGGNYSQYFRANGARYPAVILFIDNFGAFNEKTRETYLQFILKLSKEGASNGIYLFISGAGYNMSEIPNRLAENMGTAIGICLADKFGYCDVLRTLRMEIMPEAGIKGRGLGYVDGRILEIQIALALEAEDDYKRNELITERCKAIHDAWSGTHARRIPEIPEKPTWEIFKERGEIAEIAETDNIIPIGYRSDNALIYGLDMFKNYCFLINGAQNTGKKSFMRLMILAALMKKNTDIVIIDNGSEFRDMSDNPNIRFIKDADELYEWTFNELTPMFKERNAVKRKLLDDGYEDEQFYAGMKRFDSVFIFIASMSWFVKAVYDDAHNMKGFMENIFSKGEDHKISFIGCLGVNERTVVGGYEIFNTFASNKNGIHLGGNVSINPWLSFDYLRASEQVVSLGAGVGQLSVQSGGNAGFKLIVPLARREKKIYREEDTH